MSGARVGVVGACARVRACVHNSVTVLLPVTADLLVQSLDADHDGMILLDEIKTMMAGAATQVSLRVPPAKLSVLRDLFSRRGGVAGFICASNSVSCVRFRRELTGGHLPQY